ncbi:ABC transporter permease [Paenibacillus larvae]|uniref:Choline transport system permease protein OpuBB n=1 Tax=Paenibacillus larvae subsp. larvae TaxID=147375 RepID=A0A6C0QXR7_9BACL|nr:ABC transporter permease [Paenibacillus larvae]QHZ53473.1 choline transport system permease protein OpuBB [Paenibacillus larvae subsp. larvae]
MNVFITYWSERTGDIMTALGEHIMITFVSVTLGCLVAIPLGIFLAGNRVKFINSIVFMISNVLQTIPSLALLAMLIPLLGVGIKPAIFALFLYSIMPILRNTYTGFRSVDLNLIEGARGMGYSTRQRLFLIQLPLSFPYIMSGIRTTTVYIISWATLATLIGGGGLGQLIFSGMGVNKNEMIVTGALLAVVLALVIDFILGRVEIFVDNKVKSKPVQV